MNYGNERYDWPYTISPTHRPPIIFSLTNKLATVVSESNESPHDLFNSIFPISYTYKYTHNT